MQRYVICTTPLTSDPSPDGRLCPVVAADVFGHVRYRRAPSHSNNVVGVELQSANLVEEVVPVPLHGYHGRRVQLLRLLRLPTPHGLEFVLHLVAADGAVRDGRRLPREPDPVSLLDLGPQESWRASGPVPRRLVHQVVREFAGAGSRQDGHANLVEGPRPQLVQPDLLGGGADVEGLLTADAVGRVFLRVDGAILDPVPGDDAHPVRAVQPPADFHPVLLDDVDPDRLQLADDLVVEDGAGGPHHARRPPSRVGGHRELVDVRSGERDVHRLLLRPHVDPFEVALTLIWPVPVVEGLAPVHSVAVHVGKIDRFHPRHFKKLLTVGDLREGSRLKSPH